jgi:hypothetical protein
MAVEKAYQRFRVIGFPALAACLLAEALLQWRYLGTDNKVGNAFAVFFIFVFIVFHQVGFNQRYGRKEMLTVHRVSMLQPSCMCRRYSQQQLDIKV